MESQLQKPALANTDDVIRKKKAKKQDVVQKVVQSPGEQLSPSVKSDMEAHFARDFSNVRIHSDPVSNQSAQSVNAAAFTYGNHIAFGPGQYQPQSSDGRKLLAHELAHTVQQSQNPTLSAKSLGHASSNVFEAEADRAAEMVGANRPVTVNFSPTPASVQRKVLPGSTDSSLEEPASDQFGLEEEETKKKKSQPFADFDAIGDTQAISTPVAQSPTPMKSTVPTGGEVMPSVAVVVSEPATLRTEQPESKMSKPDNATELKDITSSPRKTSVHVESRSAQSSKKQVTVGKPTSRKPSKPLPTNPKLSNSKKGKEELTEQKPNPRSEIAPAIKAVRQRARKASRHSAAEALSKNAQAAGQQPKVEQTRLAASQTVNNIEGAESKPVNRESFADQLRRALQEAVPIPDSPEQAKELTKSGGKNTSRAVKGKLASAITPATKDLKKNASEQGEASPAKQSVAPGQKLISDKAGAKLEPVSPAPVVPKPIPASRLDFSSHASQTDEAMKSSQVSLEQLRKGNEPEFNNVLKSRSEAESHQAEVPNQYRVSEKAEHGSTESAAAKLLSKGMNAFGKSRTAGIGKSKQSQTSTQNKESAERKRITTEISSIKNQTQSEVNEVLSSMETTVESMFATGLEMAETAYKKVFDDEDSNRFFNFFRSKKSVDKIVLRAFKLARAAYTNAVSTAINLIAGYVNLQIKLAKFKVSQGRKKIDQFVKSLDAESRQIGVEAAKQISGDFDAMTTGIDKRSDRLVDSLVDQYRESQVRLVAIEKELREKNRSIWDKIKDATIGAIQRIAEFKNLLMSVLAGAKKLALDILTDPIGFLSNLVKGVRQGFNLFIGNISEHLKSGLMGWLFGAMKSAGIDVPKTLDFKSILKLASQILGFTRQLIRRMAVRILGEKTVSRIESTVTFFKVLMTEGLVGVWQMVQEKLSDLKETVFGQIREFVTSKIVQAGIGMIFKLINPAGAFFAACQMIYRFVKFIMERGKQLAELVQAVVGSIGAIVSGNVSAMANKIHEALARFVPVAISLFANLAGLGGITQRIRKIVGSVRIKIEKAVMGLIRKAAGMLRSKGKNKKKKGAQTETKWEKKYGPEKGAKIEAGLAAIREKEKPFLDQEEEIEKHEAERVATYVKADHRVFKTLVVVNGGDTWDYEFTASEKNRINGMRQDEEGETRTKISKTTENGRSKNVTAKPLTNLPAEGITPSGKTNALNETWRKYRKLVPGLRNKFVRAHLLHGKFGPNEDWNLTLATSYANKQMQLHEKKIIDRVKEGKVMWYSITVVDRHSSVPDFAKNIQLEYGGLDKEKGSTESSTIFSFAPDMASDILDVNVASVSEIVQIVGIDNELAEIIVSERNSLGEFTSRKNLVFRISTHGVGEDETKDLIAREKAGIFVVS